MLIDSFICDVLQKLLVSHFIRSDPVSDFKVIHGACFELSQLPDSCLTRQLLLNLIELALGDLVDLFIEILFLFLHKEASGGEGHTGLTGGGWQAPFTPGLSDLPSKNLHSFISALHVFILRLLPVLDFLAIAHDLESVLVAAALSQVSLQECINCALADLQLVEIVRHLFGENFLLEGIYVTALSATFCHKAVIGGLQNIFDNDTARLFGLHHMRSLGKGFEEVLCFAVWKNLLAVFKTAFEAYVALITHCNALQDISIVRHRRNTCTVWLLSVYLRLLRKFFL